MNELKEAISAVQNAIKRAECADAGGAILQKADLTNVLFLLKAQQPRVMTLDEVKTWNNQSVYSKENIFIENFADDFGTLAYVGDFRNRSYPTEESAFSGYEKSWRCWTSRPSDEQRKVTPWKN